MSARYFGVGLFVLLSLTMLCRATADPTLLRLRTMFYQASESSDLADALLTETESISDQTPVLYGYRAMADMMQAKHSFNPFSKLKYFNSGRDKLERAIALAPASVELRFLRFAVQSKAPSMLGYGQNLDEDKSALFRYVEAQKAKPDDKDLLAHISQFLSNCDECTPEERRQMAEVSRLYKQ